MKSATVKKAPQGFSRDHVTAGGWFLILLIGLMTSAVVWPSLYQGGSLIGGDTWPYFFPQKQLLSESFAAGQLPLWNDRTSYGYPMHAESQAAVFYPPTQVLYRLFDVSTAYSVSILLHYVLAMVFTWRLLRSQGLTFSSAVLGAIIFVYGWFPARASLEWSIIGGVWFPVCLWLTDRWLKTPSTTNWIILAASFGCHLLAGHFALAFVTELSCLAFAGFQIVWARKQQTEVPEPSAASRAERPQDSPAIVQHPAKRFAFVGMALAAGILLASVQLLPTLELKRLSQREGENKVFNPQYGHMPPVYVTQLFASWWYWHTPEMILSREFMKYPLTVAADSNVVEAHLYLGLIPLLILLTLLDSRIRKGIAENIWIPWMIAGVAAIIYATGWLVPVMKVIPGFGYFMGPARYTIVTAMAGAVLSGAALDVILRRRSAWLRASIPLILAAVTLPDLLWSDRAVSDAVQISSSPMAQLKFSWIAETLRTAGVHDVRLLMPGPNVGNLYGVSCVPHYLGLGPSAYYVDQTTYRTRPAEGDSGEFPSPEEVSRLKQRGVTHILATEAFSQPSSELELVQAGPDPFLNMVWGRGNSPCFLYRFREQPSRVVIRNARQTPDWEWILHTSTQIEFRIRCEEECDVVLRELIYPGWDVAVDDAACSASELPEADPDGLFRVVRVNAGEHVIRWSYSPLSFQAGFSLTAFTFVVLLMAPVFARTICRHRTP
ncbi:MAG: hypothetical protein ACK50J_06240 [Planctomyces sp.]